MKLEFPSKSDVALVRITGNRKNAEPAHVRIMFPGGHVEVTRAVDGDAADYWVHVYVNRSNDGHHAYDEEDTAKISDARLDIHGKHSADVNAGDFTDKNLYHIALRVTRDCMKERIAQWRKSLLKHA